MQNLHREFNVIFGDKVVFSIAARQCSLFAIIYLGHLCESIFTADRGNRKKLIAEFVTKKNVLKRLFKKLDQQKEVNNSDVRIIRLSRQQVDSVALRKAQ